MKFPRVNPTKTKSWSKLLAHKNNIKTLDEFFSKNQNRQKSFSIEWNKFFLDFSKTHVDRNILEDLVALAEECGLSRAIDAMFSGKKLMKPVLLYTSPSPRDLSTSRMPSSA